MRKLPGEAGVWIIVFGDLLVFSVMFCAFMYGRRADAALFEASRLLLRQSIGLFNTVFMLWSSWCVANAVQAARREDKRRTIAYLQRALLCGGSFVLLKLIEYGEKIHAGIAINSNDFFMFYFMLTGIHFAHVLIGMAVLALLARGARRGIFTPTQVGYLESGASFWHLVDLLWVVLFSLLYLLP